MVMICPVYKDHASDVAIVNKLLKPFLLNPQWNVQTRLWAHDGSTLGNLVEQSLGLMRPGWELVAMVRFDCTMHFEKIK